MEAPLMRMGLIGFDSEEQLKNLLSTRNRILRWTTGHVTEADALWVNGQRAQMIREGMIRVPSVNPSQRALVLNLQEVDRPIAFTTPMHPKAMFAPSLSFDPHRADSVAGVMEAFEHQLRGPVLELCLAHEFARRRHEMRSPVFHLILGGSLVGVVVLGGPIGLARTLVGSDFERIEWSGRPASAAVISPEFLQTDMATVMWGYTGRTREDLLPRRYREGPIYFRRMPRVEQRLLRDVHLALISELRTMPQTHAQLRASTGMGELQASQALAALYFAGSITTDARKATAPVRTGAEHADSDLNTSIIGDEAPAAIPPRPGRRAAFDGPSTVPTPLETPRRS